MTEVDFPAQQWRGIAHDRQVIVDCHTHIFPPAVIEARERYLQADQTFRALYASPQATLATAEDLLGSMDATGIDVSVALAFAWQDAETCRLHNDYLIEAASLSKGRIVPFGAVPLARGAGNTEAEMRRCAALGMRGLGELRPETLGFDLDGGQGDGLATLAVELDSVLLFHVTEPVGHTYAGKEGLSVGAFYRFVARHPGVKVIGAHWGGGLPFYASMPEVKRAFEAGVAVDTAASSLLYDGGVYERGVGLIGAEHIMFGSDYPLLSQKRSLQRIRQSGLEQEALARVLGVNAAELLGLS